MTITKTIMRQILFDFADSMLDEKSNIYVAGPLDSGQNFFKALADKNVNKDEIRKNNQSRLTHFARKLRTDLGRSVIDPGILKIPEWSGHDYGDFFIEIIERYANEAWFVDGWGFSRGATKEFIFCIENNIHCFNEHGKEITADHGYETIQKAVVYISNLGLDASKFQERLSSLQKSSLV